mmetsp:Transcript_23682/g.33161  ORF Transcript_23682/g.33161 Transcript_23682/m.33161 type:complete len:625 (+) Transcript_23682:2386-4260(+)
MLEYIIPFTILLLSAPIKANMWNFDFSSLSSTIQLDIQEMQRQCAMCVSNCSVFTTFDTQICVGDCACPPILPPPRYDYSKMVESFEEPECANGYAPKPLLQQIESNKPKKNIVLFLMDDLDVTVTPYFEAMPFARWLFENNGVTFENAYTSTSICCAARCQLMTGLYGHNVGVISNGGLYGGWEAFVKPLDAQGYRQKDEQGRCINNEDRTIAKFLHDYAGYKTAIFGKLMNGFENEDTHVIQKLMPGWTQFDVSAERSFYSGFAYSLSNYNEDDSDFRMKYYGLRSFDYVTDVLTMKALRFITRYRNNPFFVYIGNAAPHFPIAAAPRHRTLQHNWDTRFDEFVTSRPNYNNITQEATPTWFTQSRPYRDNVMNSTWIRTEWIKRMGSLYAVDDMIRSTYRLIERLGLLENTIFILTGDNGYNMGSHKLIHKQAPYEESIRVPLHVAGEGVRRGVRITSRAMLMDLFPTILEYANLQSPSYVDGISLFNQIMESANPVRTYERDMYLQYRKFTEQQGEGPSISTEFLPGVVYFAPPGFNLDVPPYEGIRTETHLFVKWDYRGMNLTNPTQAIAYELYDMQNDPYQLHNLAYNPEQQSLLEELEDKLKALSFCQGRNCYPTPA